MPISDGYGYFSVMTGDDHSQTVQLSNFNESGPVEIRIISGNIICNDDDVSIFSALAEYPLVKVCDHFGVDFGVERYHLAPLIYPTPFTIKTSFWNQEGSVEVEYRLLVGMSPGSPVNRIHIKKFSAMS